MADKDFQMKELELLRKENPAFVAWVKTLPPSHWAIRDLSAARLGWEMARAETTQKLREIASRCDDARAARELLELANAR